MMFFFIVNRRARTGKAGTIWDKINENLKARKVPYQAYVTEYKGHAMELAETICAQVKSGLHGSETPVLAVLGGDGTINEVINGITDFSCIRFAVMPIGSGNDFASGMKLEQDPFLALERILNGGTETQIDLGRVTWNQGEGSRLFAISTGIGLDAIVCHHADQSKLKTILNQLHLGNLVYILLTVSTLFSMKTMTISALMEGTRRKRFGKGIFAAAMNLRSEGGGVPMAPGAVPNDGKLNLCTAFGIPKWRTFFLLPLLMAAKHEGIHGFHVETFQHCEIKLDQPAVLHADGEYCGMVSAVELECVPGILRLIR